MNSTKMSINTLDLRYHRRRLMHLALIKHKGQVGQAAKALGCSAKTLRRELLHPSEGIKE